MTMALTYQAVLVALMKGILMSLGDTLSDNNTASKKYIRMAITKGTSSEQLVVDMPSWNPVTGEPLDANVESMMETMEECLAVLDRREQDVKLRMLEVYGIFNYFPVEYHSRIIEIVDILTGRASAELVVQRWKAAAEETADLERGRRDAYIQQMAEAPGHTCPCCNEQNGYHAYGCALA